MKSLKPDLIQSQPKLSAFALGFVFLLVYWMFGFDGITFSDDVYYLLAGQKFWEGTMEVNNYHFSSRWGAYVPSGLIGFLLGFDPHKISLISLLSYVISLFLLLKILPRSAPAWVLILWFCTQVYFLHFLTKVYPDSLLVLWVVLVPVAAVYRKSKPVASGILLVSSLFIGFITKETIIFLAPFPLLLFFFDWKRNQVNSIFYASLVLTGIFLSLAYLGYFWIKFGDPLHRITSINDGHYISEFTYADKGLWAILERLTILPILTFIKRSYWVWIVFALPGIAIGLKAKKTPEFEFSLAFLCLLVGFWLMTSTLDFYNPIYLNPRHLIIIVPILSMLIALGWKKWQASGTWKVYMIALLLVGTAISLVQMDLKMAAFNLILAMGVRFSNLRIFSSFMMLILIAPALLAISYQQKLKQYDLLKYTLENETQKTHIQTFIYTHSFLDFSKKVMLPEDTISQELLIPLYQFPTDSSKFPKQLKVLTYDYYLHAYPEEQKDLDEISGKLSKYYELRRTYKTGNIRVSKYERK